MDISKFNGIDFDKLLDEAKEKFNAYKVGSISANEYFTWVDDNIGKRGITMATDNFTGNPIGLYIPVAGQVD